MGKISEKDIDYICFTDGSLRRCSKTGRTYCGYGVVILNMNNKEWTSFSGELGTRSIAYGEGYAILKAIETLGKIIKTGSRNKPVEVLMATDSKLSVQVLSLYIPYVWNTNDPDNWKKKDGTRVKNQNLYKDIKALVEFYENIHFRITHINSHANALKEWRNAQNRLAQYNIWASEETAKLFIEMNRKADKLASSVTERMMKDDRENGPFYWLIAKEEML